MAIIDNYKYDKRRIIAAAVQYAKSGIAVVPLWGNDPAFPGNPLFYVKDPTEVERIFTEDERDLNVGVALGSPSGFVSISASEAADMQNGYKSYVRNCGDIPDTLRLKYAGYCHHLFRARPGQSVAGNVQLRIGLFLRGDGEYMIVPPSGYPLPIGEHEFEPSSFYDFGDLPLCPDEAYREARKRIEQLERSPLIPGNERIPQFW